MTPDLLGRPARGMVDERPVLSMVIRMPSDRVGEGPTDRRARSCSCAKTGVCSPGAIALRWTCHPTIRTCPFQPREGSRWEIAVRMLFRRPGRLRESRSFASPSRERFAFSSCFWGRCCSLLGPKSMDARQIGHTTTRWQPRRNEEVVLLGIRCGRRSGNQTRPGDRRRRP